MARWKGVVFRLSGQLLLGMSPPQAQDNVLPTYTREEVAKHKKYNDCWVVLHGQVYDVTKWLPKHPGGARLLMHYAGEDATVSATKNVLGLLWWGSP